MNASTDAVIEAVESRGWKWSLTAEDRRDGDPEKAYSAAVWNPKGPPYKREEGPTPAAALSRALGAALLAPPPSS